MERISPLAVGAWALYDFANTIFSLNIISTYFPQFIVEDKKLNDAVYAYPQSFALLLVALIMPLLGSMSDRTGKRIPWLIGFTAMCIVSTIAMGLTDNVTLVIVAYVVASIGFQTALVFYDAPTLGKHHTQLGQDIGPRRRVRICRRSIRRTYRTPDNRLQWYKPGGLHTNRPPLPRLRAALLLPGARKEQATTCRTGARIMERRRHPDRSNAARRGKVPGLLRFLVANFFYSDALNTVIIAMGVYATQVIGFDKPITVLAPAIVTAVLGSWIFGFLTDRITGQNKPRHRSRALDNRANRRYLHHRPCYLPVWHRYPQG